MNRIKKLLKKTKKKARAVKEYSHVRLMLSSSPIILSKEGAGTVLQENMQNFAFSVGAATATTANEISPTYIFDMYGETICDIMRRYCVNVSYFPGSQTFYLTDQAFTEFVKNSFDFHKAVQKQFDQSPAEAMNSIQHFFRDKNFLIQPTGIEGAMYKVGQWTELYGSTGLVIRTLGYAHLQGVQGLYVLKAQPFLAVAVPTVGSIFFHGCGTLIGDNIVGRSCNTVGIILGYPMRVVEIMYNSYAAPVIAGITGLKTHINATQIISQGPGLTKEQMFKVISYKTPSDLKKGLKGLISKLFR